MNMLKRRTRVTGFLFVGLLFLLAACGTGNEKGAAARGGGLKGAPGLEFKEDFHDFGKVSQGEKVSYTYLFKNKGDAPLVITDVIASCGCTVPKYTDQPVGPGETGKVEVIFNTTGRAGVNYKSVTVKSNAPDGKKTLHFKANIIVPN